VALIVCGNVHRDLDGNPSLVGLFDQVSPAFLPWPLRFVVYALFTNAHGAFPARFRLVHARDAVGDPNAPCLTHAAGTIEPPEPDPLACHSVTVLMQARFAEPGDYFVEAVAAGECVGSRRIRVFPPPHSEGEPGDKV
jgi:hypothetical protein